VSLTERKEMSLFSEKKRGKRKFKIEEKRGNCGRNPIERMGER